MIEQLVFFKILIMVSVFYDFFTGQKKITILRVFSQNVQV